jgi:hypothetical protein
VRINISLDLHMEFTYWSAQSQNQAPTRVDPTSTNVAHVIVLVGE